MSTTATAVNARPGKARLVGYWIITALLTFELVYGALWDFNMLNKGYVQGMLAHLGYPAYLAPLLGVAKLLAAVAIVPPGIKLLKEWAYAGLVILFGGAFLSHRLAGDSFAASVFALVFCILALASWLMRPPSRKAGSAS